MATLGDRIKQLRNEKNITQEDLGKIVGVVKSTMSMYEGGKSTPSDEIKKIMADYFNVTMDYLMGISDERNVKGNSSSSPQLTPKDKRDIAKQVEFMVNNIEQVDGLEFYNQPQDDEDMEYIKRGLERFLEDVKIYNKVKYTPRKYKK